MPSEKQLTSANSLSDNTNSTLNNNHDSNDILTPLAIVNNDKPYFHIGPLPPPEQLRQYDIIQAGFAERIMLMAENEQKNRLFALKFTSCLAVLYCLLVCFIAIYAIHRGHPVAASVVMALNVGVVCGKLIRDYKLTIWRSNK